MRWRLENTLNHQLNQVIVMPMACSATVKSVVCDIAMLIWRIRDAMAGSPRRRVVVMGAKVESAAMRELRETEEEDAKVD